MGSPLLINYPIILTLLIIIFSMITMISTAITASSINKDDEYKKSHKTEYGLSTATSVICASSVILFILIGLWSFIYKRNLCIVLGFDKK